MSRRKKASTIPFVPAPLNGWVEFVVGPGRLPALAILIVGLFAGAWWWSWQKVHGEILADESYWLSPDDIVVTNRVEWIKPDDICREAFHNAGLQSRLSIIEPDLNERVAAAFSLHPWVAKVRRVSKRHPAAVEVELEYRRPVCMVEVPGRLIPVDVQGNVLPGGDFALNEALRFPRLARIETMPIGPPGTPWGDLRVSDGAAIAAAFGKKWDALRLERIVAAPKAAPGGRPDYTYELYTRSGSRILWGRAPQAELPGEPSAEEKVRFLEDWVARHGTLEGPRGPHEIDVPGLIRRSRLPSGSPPRGNLTAK